MDKNVKSGLTGKVILPDVVWHVFSIVSGGYNKVRKEGGGALPQHPHQLARAHIGHVVTNSCALQIGLRFVNFGQKNNILNKVLEGQL